MNIGGAATSVDCVECDAHFGPFLMEFGFEYSLRLIGE